MDVETPAPEDLLARLSTRLDDGTAGPLAVLDPRWPEPLRRSARDQLAAARAAGRLHEGDLVLFTSGATGRARGVVRTVESWRASLAPLTDLTGISATDDVWLPLPLSSSLSLYGGLHAVSVGAAVTRTRTLPPAATAAHLVPTLLDESCARAETGTPTRLRTVVVAGAVLSPGLRARAERLGWDVVEYYGAAELSFVGWRRGGGPMHDFPGARTRLDDDDRLWASSPYLARGYLDADPGGALQRDGEWATVGDLARLDRDGWRVLGRGSAAVTTGGHTVLVEDVEAALAALPGVLDVAVTGQPHPRFGQVVTAVLVVEDGVRRRDLAGRLGALPAPARPRRWLRATTIARTDTGKIRREEIARSADDLPPLP
ncbi:AMP-binding protein [Angustibacter luteus]|uniref:AMP-binding protein n=1 Tax=Angustibacter luteus TaxID=658456 RepID=A0ABW1J9Y8_9ACTN